MAMLRAGGLLDVLTPLYDCRQESVEKMERSIWGFRICTGFGLAVQPLPHMLLFSGYVTTTDFCVVGFCVHG